MSVFWFKYYWSIVWCCYNTVHFLTNIHRRHPIAHLLGRDILPQSFVDPASDWYSASVPVIIHVISYNIGPRYNGTWLYMSFKGLADKKSSLV